MKFYSSGLIDLINKIDKGNVKAVLLHGQNQGFIVRCSFCQKNMHAKWHRQKERHARTHAEL